MWSDNDGELCARDLDEKAMLVVVGVLERSSIYRRPRIITVSRYAGMVSIAAAMMVMEA